MDTSQHSLSTLFAQLGLSSDAESIDHFIAEHAPLDPAVQVADANFWQPAQASFLRQQLIADADWAEVVDELSLKLRG
jgi:uncharacterized protein involved in type VI secretion and phage assembly